METRQRGLPAPGEPEDPEAESLPPGPRARYLIALRGRLQPRAGLARRPRGHASAASARSEGLRESAGGGSRAGGCGSAAPPRAVWHRVPARGASRRAHPFALRSALAASRAGELGMATAGTTGATLWVKGPPQWGGCQPSSLLTRPGAGREHAFLLPGDGAGGLEDRPEVGRESGGSRREQWRGGREGGRKRSCLLSSLPQKHLSEDGCPNAGRSSLCASTAVFPSLGFLRLCPWLSAVLITAGSSLEANLVPPKMTKGRSSAVGRERRPSWPLAAVEITSSLPWSPPGDTPSPWPQAHAWTHGWEQAGPLVSL